MDLCLEGMVENHKKEIGNLLVKRKVLDFYFLLLLDNLEQEIDSDFHVSFLPSKIALPSIEFGNK